MNPTIKKILLAGGLGVIAWLFVMFIFHTVTVLIGWIIFAIILLYAYALWNKHARTELMKKEENFDELVKSRKFPKIVIPVNAGIKKFQRVIKIL